MADRNWLFPGVGVTPSSLVLAAGGVVAVGPDTPLPDEICIPVALEEVALFEVQSPLRGARLAKAIPFFLEERLTEDLDGLHFAWGLSGDDATIPTVVTSRRAMDAWRERLRELGVRHAHLIPELYLLPYESGRWTLALAGERALLRTGPHAGCVVHVGAIAAVLAALASDADAPLALRVYGAADAKTAIPWAEIPGLGLEFVTADIGPAWFAGHADPDGIDLCQGEFARRDPWAERMRPWLAPAALLLAWLAVGAVQSGLEARRLAAENEALGREMYRIFEETFPNTKRVVDPSTQMRQAVARLGGAGSTDVWPFLDALSTALGENPGWRLSTLRYRKDTLEAGVEVASLAALEKLRDGIARAGGFQVEMSSVTPEKDRVTSRLVVKR